VATPSHTAHSCVIDLGFILIHCVYIENLEDSPVAALILVPKNSNFEACTGTRIRHGDIFPPSIHIWLGVSGNVTDTASTTDSRGLGTSTVIMSARPFQLHYCPILTIQPLPDVCAIYDVWTLKESRG
jgi:hypothetical protein